MSLETPKEQKLSEAEALEWIRKIVDLIMKLNENCDILSVRHIPLSDPENFKNKLGCLLFGLLEDFEVIKEPETNNKQEVIDMIEMLCDELEQGEEISKEAKELLSEYNVRKLNRSCPVPLAMGLMFEAQCNVKMKNKHNKK